MGRPRVITFTPTQLDSMAKAYARGASALRLAVEFGLSRPTVLALLRERAVAIRSRGKPMKPHRTRRSASMWR